MIDEMDTIMGEPQLPASQVDEEAVLACVMIDSRSLAQVIDRLEPAHFYFEHTRSVYEAMVALWSERAPIDFLALTTELEHRGRLRLLNVERRSRGNEG